MRHYIINKLFEILYKIKPRYAAEFMYRHAFHKPMNLDDPKDLIEKINWLQFNSDTSMWTLCADKYRMREYVAECGLSDYLPKLYGHWDDPDDIDFDELPTEFVLKSNNGCGTVKIVRDKRDLDIKATRKVLKGWLKPFGYIAGQSHYLRIKPCIIAEELLHQSEENNNLSPKSLIDYKIWCINGEPESIWVAYNRQNGMTVNMALYDTKWTPMPQHLRNTNLETYNPDVEIPKPDCLDEMLDIAKKISKPFPEVRVDCYIIEGKPVIGELTFSTGYGYFTEEYYAQLGKKLKLSNSKLGGQKSFVES